MVPLGLTMTVSGDKYEAEKIYKSMNLTLWSKWLQNGRLDANRPDIARRFLARKPLLAEYLALSSRVSLYISLCLFAVYLWSTPHFCLLPQEAHSP
jgi:hypothetical protein